MSYTDQKLARTCFEENCRLFAHPQQRPEQYNLYNGLACLAAMNEALLQRVELLETKLNVLLDRVS